MEIVFTNNDENIEEFIMKIEMMSGKIEVIVKYEDKIVSEVGFNTYLIKFYENNSVTNSEQTTTFPMNYIRDYAPESFDPTEVVATFNRVIASWYEFITKAKEQERAKEEFMNLKLDTNLSYD